jgi:hypothetical protein
LNAAPSDKDIILSGVLPNFEVFFYEIFWFKCRSSLLEHMPVLDEASYLLKRAATTTKVTPGGLKLQNGVAKPTSAPLADLLDLNSDAPG